jgi:hypothetical protein
MDILKHFVGAAQLRTLKVFSRGSEGEYFQRLLIALVETVKAMPYTGQTDGLGDEAFVILHYSLGPTDWWITERDQNLGKQTQASGYVCIGDSGFVGMGCVSIAEIIAMGAELDLNFVPTRLGDIKQALRDRIADPLYCAACQEEMILQPCEACEAGRMAS